MAHEFVSAFHTTDELAIVEFCMQLHPLSPNPDNEPGPHGTHAPFKLYWPIGHGVHDFETWSSVYPSGHVGVHVRLSVQVPPFIE